MNRIRTQLKNRWSLICGGDSLEIMPSLRETSDEQWSLSGDFDEYKRVDFMKVLGHYVMKNGCIGVDYEEAKEQAEASLVRSFSPALRQSSLNTKSRFLHAHIMCHFRSRWSRWPIQPMYQTKLNSFQVRCLQTLMCFSKLPTESVDAFCRKRLLLCGRLAVSCGRWSDGWTTGSVLWYKHVMRGNGPVCSNHKRIVDYHDCFWLNKRRAEMTACRSHGKTRMCVRPKAGHIAHRFQESVITRVHDPPVKFKHLCYSMFFPHA